MASFILEKYNDYVMMHSCNIYQKTPGMEKVTIFAYPLYEYALPHWICVLYCCANCPHISIPS